MDAKLRVLFSLAVLFLSSAVRGATACSCHGKWKHLLTTSKAGSATFGSKADLTTAVMSGSDVRILLPSLNYLTSVQNVHTLGDNVCGQALMHISKSGYDSFQEKAYWWFLNVCTTGQVQMNRYYVGNHVSNGMNTDTYEIKWFAREFKDSTLKHSSNGAVISGSVNDVIGDVEVGSDVRVVAGEYAATMNSVQVSANKDLVVGQAVWHVSQKEVPPNIEFQGNDYWWFTNWATDGTAAASRWQIGDHISRGETTDARALNWHTDNCWMLAYQHDASGNEVQGSLDFLRSAILQGHRVKVMFDNISAEPDEVAVRGGHVNAVLISMVAKSSSDIRAFNAGGMWDWRILSTTGNETTLRVHVGEYVEQGRTAGKKAVNWFIDTRPWVKVLANSKTGSVLSGSKAALVSSVQSGARVRYIINVTPPPFDVSVHEADTLAVSGEEVSAAHIRAVSWLGLPTEVQFQSRPYWFFTQSTTTGKFDRSRWTVGEHESRGHTNTTAEIEWFVNY